MTSSVFTPVYGRRLLWATDAGERYELTRSNWEQPGGVLSRHAMPWKHLDVRKTVRGPRQRPSSDVRHAAGGVAEAGGSHSARAVTFRPSPKEPRARSSGRRGPRGPSQGPDAHAGQLADVSSGPLSQRAGLQRPEFSGASYGRLCAWLDAWPAAVPCRRLPRFPRDRRGCSRPPALEPGESRRPPEAHILPGKGRPRHFWAFLQAGDRGQYRPRKRRLVGNPLGAEVPGVVGWGSRPESGTVV